MRRILILLATHLLTLGLGFGLGVYLLPILIAPMTRRSPRYRPQ